MKALLIIDMQVGVFADSSRIDEEIVVDKVNRLSKWCREHSVPVLFVRHNGTKENCLFPGTPEWQMLPTLVRSENDIVLEKTANDAFYRTGLDDKLKQLGTTELMITGCATDFCVNATVHSALVKDYVVTVVADGHTTANRPDLSASQIIRFHNWLWTNLTPTNGRVQVRELTELISE